MPLERRMIVTVLRSEIHINSAAVSTALEVVRTDMLPSYFKRFCDPLILIKIVSLQYLGCLLSGCMKQFFRSSVQLLCNVAVSEIAISFHSGSLVTVKDLKWSVNWPRRIVLLRGCPSIAQEFSTVTLYNKVVRVLVKALVKGIGHPK